jgi:hypothetical protein
MLHAMTTAGGKYQQWLVRDIRWAHYDTLKEWGLMRLRKYINRNISVCSVH